jgi:hypothetical protein
VISWLDTDPATWNVVAAGYAQSCPDDCGNRIEVGTPITRASGVWRRRTCVLRQWNDYQRLVLTGTQAELTAAIKRVTRLGGYLVVRGWDPREARDARFRWTEVTPTEEEDR